MFDVISELYVTNISELILELILFVITELLSITLFGCTNIFEFISDFLLIFMLEYKSLE
ncbi:hypothetical protein D3C73_1363120 [compost metagenome]